MLRLFATRGARQLAQGGAQLARGFASEAGGAQKKGSVSGPSEFSIADRGLPSAQALCRLSKAPCRHRNGRPAGGVGLHATYYGMCLCLWSSPLTAPRLHCLPQSLPLLLALTGAAGGLYYAKEQGLLDGLVGVPAPVKVRPPKQLRTVCWSCDFCSVP